MKAKHTAFSFLVLLKEVFVMSTRLMLVAGLFACCVGIGFASGDLVRLVNGYQVLSCEEASHITAGDWENQACEGAATGTCPSGTPPAPNDCTMTSLVLCLLSSCYSCNPTTGAMYQQCKTFPDTDCLENSSGTPCGLRSKDGCDLPLFPAVTCACNGPMGPLTTPCHNSDCQTDFNGNGQPGY